MNDEAVRRGVNDSVSRQGGSPELGTTLSGLTKQDRVIALGFFALAASAVLLVTGSRATSITEKASNSRWFEADSPKILGSMSDRFADNARTKLHPIFPLLTYPLISGITRIGNVPPLEAVWLLNAATAGVWLGTFYLIMRLLGCRLLDSLLFTSLAASSGAAMFWFIMPETYPLGSLMILLALGLVALAPPSPCAGLVVRSGERRGLGYYADELAGRVELCIRLQAAATGCRAVAYRFGYRLRTGPGAESLIPTCQRSISQPEGLHKP